MPVLCQIRQKRLILPRIAEPGIGPVAVRPSAGHCACGDQAADPYSRYRSGPWIGPGAAIWKNALLGASRWLTPEPVASAPGCALRSPPNAPMHRTAKPALAILCQIAQKRLTFALDSRTGNRAGRRSHQGSLSALAAIRRQSHIPIADPVNGSDRERRSGKRCWVLCGGCHKPAAKQAKMRCPVFPFRFRTPEPCCS